MKTCDYCLEEDEWCTVTEEWGTICPECHEHFVNEQALYDESLQYDFEGEE